MTRYMTLLMIGISLTLGLFFAPSAHAQNIDCAQIPRNQQTGPARIICAPQPKIQIPGLSFRSARELADLQTDDGTIVIPFLGEYIAAIYRWAVVLITVLGSIMIIVGGVRWLTSAGSPEAISQAQNMILKAIMGVVIAAGSYTVLYLVSPALVEFGGLRVKVSEPAESIFENDDVVYTPSYITAINQFTTDLPSFIADDATITEPPWTEPEEFRCPYNGPEYGVLPEQFTVSYQCPGCDGRIRTIPEMQEPLCRVCAAAQRAGYTIDIRSSYRDFEGQVENWCNSTEPLATRRSFNALPGYSNHGHGRAVDVRLQRNGEDVTGGGRSDQCNNTRGEDARQLFDFFINTDPNFARLSTEIWHFEYGTVSQSARIRTYAAPSRCDEDDCINNPTACE